MKMLVAGGGTGGHLFPGVALAQRLLELEPESRVQFVGTKQGIEAKILPELKLRLATIDISGWRGRPWLQRLALLPKLARSVRQAAAILDRFRPEVVVGTGGFVSAPVLAAARLKGYPTVIHEQNAEPGLANRLLAPWVDRVCVSWSPRGKGAFARRATVVTGNPLRQGMDRCPPLSDLPAAPPTLLVFGGSRGAKALNEAMLAALPELEAWRGRLRIRHQTGAEDHARIVEGYREAGWDRAEVEPFIRDMATAYAEAHLVVCRAGATTLAELAGCGRPAILVPYPYATGDHQTANAAAAVGDGAARMMSQGELDGARLAAAIRELLGDRDRLLAMAEAARERGVPEAADRLLDACRELVSRR